MIYDNGEKIRLATHPAYNSCKVRTRRDTPPVVHALQKTIGWWDGGSLGKSDLCVGNVFVVEKQKACVEKGVMSYKNRLVVFVRF